MAEDAAKIVSVLWSDENGEVYIDECTIWWLSSKPGSLPDLLENHDSLCGVGIFSTDATDIFRTACHFHDDAYLNRAFFEARGWTRETIDEYFLELMLDIAGDDAILQAKAETYYTLVRLFGWIVYYKHPAFNNTNRDLLYENAEETHRQATRIEE